VFDCWASLRVCFVVFVVLQGCWLAVEILCLLTRFLYLMFLFYWALLALMNLVGLFFLVFLIVLLICLLILSLFTPNKKDGGVVIYKVGTDNIITEATNRLSARLKSKYGEDSVVLILSVPTL
jgi:hypothetical protein